MVISIVPGSASMQLTQRPRIRAPWFDTKSLWIVCDVTPIRITGAATAEGNFDGSTGGCTLGMIQLQSIETHWAYYRGRVDADGSVLQQAARPPARPIQACRDATHSTSIFYDFTPAWNPKPVAHSGLLRPMLWDKPSAGFPTTVLNSKTGKPNFLEELQVEFQFCTILSFRQADGRFQHLMHIYWNVHWQAQVRPSNYADVRQTWTINLKGGAIGNSANVSQPILGGPTSSAFTRIITAPSVPTANDIGYAAYANPNTLESRRWTSFDVVR
jgi:hypothetical protein